MEEEITRDNQIYRNLPKGYNPHLEFLERREKVYNPHPVSSQRVNSSYFSIKDDISTYQAFDIIKKLPSKIKYFTYNNNLYKLDDLPWETLYKDTTKNLIPKEKLFTSTQKIFLDEHIKAESILDTSNRNNNKNNNRNNNRNNNSNNSVSKADTETPITASYFMSRAPETSGLMDLKYNQLLLHHQKILKILFYYFILKFNIETRKSEYSSPYHLWTNYYITDYQLINIRYHKELNLYHYIFIVEIFRENKNYGFSIYLSMYYRAEKTQIWIDKAFLSGVIPQDQLAFKNLDGYNYKNNHNTNKGLKSFDISEKPDKILDDVYQKMLNYDYRDKNIQSLSHTILTRDFDLNAGRKCFKPNDEGYPDAQTSNACLSVDPNLRKLGVWDKECKIDQDCPFFKANKNYPNNFGGCKNGVCELPVGMKKIGYRHYTKDKPLCYNCNLKQEFITADGYSSIKDRECSGIECNQCCDIQLNKTIYPELVSPDFIFENDEIERKKYARLLEMKGLKVDKIIIK